jgi:hypothetical protein
VNLTDELNKNIIKSHINSDSKMLAKHYLEAANLFKGSIEEPFFLTQSYVFSLELGDLKSIQHIFLRLKKLKRI